MDFSTVLFTLVSASGLERLTPRGEPRQSAVVGVGNAKPSVETDWREQPSSSNGVPQSDPSRRQRLPSEC